MVPNSDNNLWCKISFWLFGLNLRLYLRSLRVGPNDVLLVNHRRVNLEALSRIPSKYKTPVIPMECLEDVRIETKEAIADIIGYGRNVNIQERMRQQSRLMAHFALKNVLLVPRRRPRWVPKLIFAKLLGLVAEPTLISSSPKFY